MRPLGSCTIGGSLDEHEGMLCEFYVQVKGCVRCYPLDHLKVNRPRYCVVLDLNGLLLHRSSTRVNQRTGCLEFLDWLFKCARVVVWSCAMSRNVYNICYLSF